MNNESKSAEAVYKETSRIAVVSMYCAFAAIASLVIFGLLVMVGVDCGQLVIASILFSAIAFVLGITAMVVITVRRKFLKGYTYTILATLLSTPFILGVLLSILVAMVRAEREKIDTGLYNLRLLRNELVEYSKDHNGCLPIADKWCDLLLEHNNSLTKDNFRFPKPERLQLKGTCHFAFNKNLNGKRLADIPVDVVFLFEADGDWNLAGGAELLQTRYRENSYVTMIFVDGSEKNYWFYKGALRKFNKNGTSMYYEQPRWQP